MGLPRYISGRSGGIDGKETKFEAIAQAQDRLVAALGSYVTARRAIPGPSPAHGRPTIPLPALVAAKIALNGAMHAHGISNTVMAARLGLSESTIRRLTDLDQRSHTGQVETVLLALGQRLMVTSQAA